MKSVTTDKSKLTATFTYDDEKLTMDKILEALDQKSSGRYRAEVKQK